MATSRALWFVSPRRAELREEEVPDNPPEGQVLVRTLHSGISRGTECLVFSGEVPASEWQRMRAPFQEGEFPFPVKYGYANVGEVVAGPCERMGERVFCLFPHQELFVIDGAAARTIPDAVPSRRAVLGANMETALNGIWDAAPLLGDRITVVGAGVLGCLLTALLSQIPGVDVQLVDVLSEREALARPLGATFALPGDAIPERDIVFHTSASAAGLGRSVELCRAEGKVMELSWYGNRVVPLDLGGAFHSRRLRLLSSQVGHVSPNKSGWTHAQRMQLALQLLDDARLDALFEESTPFELAARALPKLLAAPSSGPPALSFAYGD